MEPNNLEKISAGLITNYLKGKNSQDLKSTIRQKISLVGIITSLLSPSWIRIIRVIVSFYKADGISPEVVLNLIDLHRPDLAQVIRESNENYIWFKNQCRDCKRLFGIG